MSFAAASGTRESCKIAGDKTDASWHAIRRRRRGLLLPKGLMMRIVETPAQETTQAIVQEQSIINQLIDHLIQ